MLKIVFLELGQIFSLTFFGKNTQTSFQNSFQKLIVKNKCLQEEVDLILTTVVHFVVAGKKAKPTDTVFGKKFSRLIPGLKPSLILKPGIFERPRITDI